MQDFDTRERRIVQNIFEHAQSKYNEEVMINPNSSFNLLKLLSAYNDILPQYGLSSVTESRIYNHLVSISKRYNPSSQQEWSAALSKASSVTPLQLKDRLSQRRKTYNTPVSQFINESSIDNSKLSLNSKSRISLKSVDRKHLLIHRNLSKDEIKQYDDSGEIFRKDYSKFDTTHMLTLSRDRMRTLMSFPTCNTQDSVQMEQLYDQYQEDKKEERMMERRAELFHKINVYSKVFLVIKATIIVKLQLKNQDIKMQKRLERCIIKTNFIQLMKRLDAKKVASQKSKISHAFYKSKLKKKTFRCFKIIKQLSIQSNRQAHPKLIQNNIGLYFIFNLLCYGLDEESKQKFKHFRKENKQKELMTLLRVYSKHSFIEPSFFDNIQNQMDQNTKLKIFQCLKQNKNRHSRTLNQLLTIQKLQVFQTLLDNFRNNKQFQERSKVCILKVRNKILNNSMWQLKKQTLERKKKHLIVQHIETIHSHQLKRGIMNIFLNQLSEVKLEHKSKQQSRMRIKQQQSLSLVSKYFCALKKNMMMNRRQKLLNEKALEFRARILMSRSFQCFLRNVICCKKQKCLRTLVEEKKRGDLMNIFKQWRKASSTRIILKIIKKVELRTTFWSVCEAVLSDKVEKRNQKYSDRFYKCMIWNRFTSQIAKHKKESQNKVNQLRQILQKKWVIEGMYRISSSLKRSFKEKENRLLSKQKIKVILNRQKINAAIQFFSKVRSSITGKQQLQTKLKLLSKIRIKSAICCLKGYLNRSNRIKYSQTKMLQIIFKTHLSKLARFSLTNKDKKRKFEQISIFQHNRKKRQLSLCMTVLKKIGQIFKCIEIKAELHYKLNLLEKVLVGFKNNIIIENGIQEISNRNIKRFNNLRKLKTFKQFRFLLRKELELQVQSNRLKQFLKHSKHCQLIHKFKLVKSSKIFQQLNKQKLVQTMKTIYLNRLQRISELRPIDNSYLTKKIWLQRFIRNVNKKLIARKMDEMATLHYMQTILGKSIKMLKQCKQTNQ